MELEERLSYLENVRDWQSLVEELEKGIASSARERRQGAVSPEARAASSRRSFSPGVKALKHFQDAYKLNPALDREPRGGAQRLLGPRQAQHGPEAPRAGAEGERGRARARARLLLELGDVLCDQGDWDKAAATYARSLGLSGGKNAEASACLADVQVDARLAGAPRRRSCAGERDERAPRREGAACFSAPRASRAASRPTRPRGCSRARTRPTLDDKQIAALYEGAARRAGALRRARAGAARRFSQQTADRASARALALDVRDALGPRVTRTSTSALAFLEEALKLDPDERRRVLLPARGVRQEGRRLGSRPRRSPKRRRRAPRTANSHVPARAGGDDRVAAARQPDPRAPLVRAAERRLARAPAAPRVRGADRRDAEAGRRAARDRRASRRPGRRARDGRADAARAAAPCRRRVAERRPPRRPAACAGPRAAAVRRPSAPPRPRPRRRRRRRRRARRLPREPPRRRREDRRAARSSPTSRKPPSATTSTSRRCCSSRRSCPTRDEKVALYTKAADLYVTKFANQAEAVKAYEAVLAIDPDHAQAVDYLRQMYEKRRDWEKLLGLQRREAERMPPGAERAAKFLEIAKLATERVKKPEVCIELWQEVLEQRRVERRSARRPRGLYERAKDFEQARDGARAAGRDHVRRAGEDPGPDEARDDLRRAPQQRRGRGQRVARRSSRSTRTIAARRTRSRRSTWRSAAGTTSRSSTPRAASGTSSSASSSSKRRRRRTPTPKISLLFKIAQLWADKKQKLDRAAKAYEKVLELEPDNLQAAEALIPIYTAANNAKALANAIEVKLGHEQDPTAKLELYREVAALYEGKVKDPQKAFDRYLAAFELFPGDERTSDDVERVARRSPARWDEVVAAYRRAIDAGRLRTASATTGIMLRLRLGRVLVENVAEGRRGARRLPRRLRRRRRERRGDRARSSGSIGRRRASPISSASTRRSATSRTTADEKKAINYEIAQALRERDQGRRQGDRHVRRRSSRTSRATRRRSRRSTCSTDGSARWEPYVDVLRRRIELDVGESGAHRSQVPPRADAREAPGRSRRARSRTTARSSSSTRSTRARVRRSRRCSTATCAPKPRRSSSRSTRSAATGRSSSTRSRSSAPAKADIEKRVALKRKAARISAERVNDSAHAFAVLASALRDDPALAETRDEIEAHRRRRPARSASSSRSTASSPTSSDRRGARARLLDAHRRRSTTASATSTARREAYYKVLAIDPGDAEALAALEQLFTRTAAVEGPHRRRRAPHRADERRRASARRSTRRWRRSTTSASGARKTPSRAYKKVLELDPGERARAHARSTISSRVRRCGASSPRTSRRSSRSRPRTRRSSRSCSASRRSARREMGLVDVAIEGYRQVLERVADERAGARGARAPRAATPSTSSTIADLLEPLYRHIGDWQKLIGVHEVQVRRSEDVDPPGRAAPPDRAALRGRRGRPRRRRSPRSRARCKEDPANEATQQQLDRVARATGRFADLAQRLRGARRADRGSDARERALR